MSAVSPAIARDANVFIFFEKLSFRYDYDDEKSKTKRSLLITIIYVFIIIANLKISEELYNKDCQQKKNNFMFQLYVLGTT